MLRTLYGQALSLCLALAIVAATLIVFGGAAFAQATGNTVDLQPLVSTLTETIVDVVVSLLGILGLWLAMFLKKKWGIDIENSVRSIEANHRDALHSAVDTWTRAAITKFGPNLSFEVNNDVMRYVINGVLKSAPDAVKALGATETWIVNKAAAVAGVTPVIVPAAP